jgi:hypothetical protein
MGFPFVAALPTGVLIPIGVSYKDDATKPPRRGGTLDPIALSFGDGQVGDSLTISR